MFNAVAGPVRIAVKNLPCRPGVAPAFRQLHASSSVLKKSSKASRNEEPIFDDEEDLSNTDDLFGATTSSLPTAASTSSTSSAALSAERREIRQAIWTVVHRGSTPRSTVRETRRAQVPIPSAALDQYIQACESKEDLQSLKRLLRGWRIMGRPVSSRNGNEIIRKCMALDSIGLSVELLDNPTQYGITSVSHQTLAELYSAILRDPSEPYALPKVYLAAPRHSIAVGHLAAMSLRTKRRKSEATPPSPSSEISSDSESEASETTTPTRKSHSTAPRSNSKKSALGSLKITADRPFAVMSRSEIDLIDAALPMLEQAGGKWQTIAEEVMDRSAWYIYRKERLQKLGVADPQAA